MDKRTKKRYFKIKKDQKKLEEEIEIKKEELKNLKVEEKKIAGQEILSICKNNDMSFLEALDIFSDNDFENDDNNKEKDAHEN